MRVHISLNLTLLNNTTFSSVFYLEFDNITSLTNWYNEDESEHVTTLEFNNGSTDKTIYVFIDGATTPTYDQTNDLYELADIRDVPLTLECDIPDNMRNRFWEFVQLGIISVIEPIGKTTLYVFKQNSENDETQKTLTLIDVINGKFNHSIAVKLINVDLTNYNVKDAYNYVYIPSLNRYYYVDSIEIISGDYVRLHLKEDVLMSWRTLIRQQKAFVTRCENTNNKNVLVDERLPIEDVINYNFYKPTSVQNSDVNVTFDFKQYEYQGVDNKNILFNAYTENLYSSLPNYVIEPPANSGLPKISSLRSKANFCALLPYTSLQALINACVKDDATASYITSLIWLPFNPASVFPNLQATTHTHCGGKVLDGVDGGKWVSQGSVSLPIGSTWVHDGACPYLFIADFMFNSTGGITNINANAGIEIYKPYSKWEIFIPFVGWVELDISQVKNKRIQIMYSFDLETGLSTAYIYNRTDKIVLHSATCQIGVRLSITTTNELEITKQKQANDLNMILGTISSVVSIGVGAYSGNAVAVAGGVLSASKTIASYVNSNNMLFERANTSFGSSLNALYSPNEILIRHSQHNKITIDENVYKHMQGYPVNSYGELSSFSGYVEIGEIHFNPMNYPIYQDEIEEIVSLLKDGVIL